MIKSKFLVNRQAFTLIEILVVVGIFAVVAIVVVSAVILSIRGSVKTDRSISVRENLDYSLSLMEREVRNAKSVDSCPSPNTITFTDSDGMTSTIECKLGADWGYVDLRGQRITGSDILITNCTFLVLPEVSVLLMLILVFQKIC
jgi:prepilin-type N-terminal cleavage/methylation domain-containing protein